MSLAPGARIGPYEVMCALGVGGMGEVYRAHDPRLGRDVAIKLLPAALRSDPARIERFAREARAVATLNHPHIVTIYSTEEADGVRFLTMELVEGQALDELIPAGGLPLRRFLEIALPLADALTAAHQRNISHRDLKPANVMVTTDGRVKVLDFGLASVAPTPGTLCSDSEQEVAQPDAPTVASPWMTTPGTIMGTMPYMSPEQIEGKSLDYRTDLFSLGVMLHEMLTGVRPFTGDTSAQLVSSILRDEPPSASDMRPDVPEALSHLLQRCLEKRPDDRVQTARDVYNELRHLQKQLESGQREPVKIGPQTAGHALSPEHARSTADACIVTILQFTSPTAGDHASDLADGLTQGIVVGLSRFSYLRVVKRNGPTDSVAAGYVLQGSVRKAGDVVRIVTQLTEAATGRSLWADSVRSARRGWIAVRPTRRDRGQNRRHCRRHQWGARSYDDGRRPAEASDDAEPVRSGAPPSGLRGFEVA